MIELDVQSYLFASRDEIKFKCHTCNERVEGTFRINAFRLEALWNATAQSSWKIF